MRAGLCVSMLCVMLVLYSCQSPAEAGFDAAKRVTNECRYAIGKVTVDGTLSESAWEHAVVLPFMVAKTSAVPNEPAEARVLWDENNLYVAFSVKDKDLFATYSTRDAMTWKEDVVELFFKIDPQHESYYEFEWNPINTIFDAMFGKRGAGDHHRWTVWNCSGLKSAVTINGTLTNWHDTDEGWILEAAIPFSSLSIGKAPQTNTRWLFNLTRHNYSVHLPTPRGHELSTVSFLPSGDFHRFEEWAFLKFVQ